MRKGKDNLGVGQSKLMYKAGCGLSRILLLKGINQKHRYKQLVSMNLIAIKIKTYIRRCLNEMPFN